MHRLQYIVWLLNKIKWVVTSWCRCKGYYIDEGHEWNITCVYQYGGLLVYSTNSMPPQRLQTCSCLRIPQSNGMVRGGKNCWPSRQNVTEFTQPLCPFSVCKLAPVFAFHSRTVSSSDFRGISKLLAVRRKGYPIYKVRMPFQRLQTCSCFRIPQSNSTVIRGRSKLRAVRRKCHWYYTVGMPL